jgi:hypothetical protein
MQHRVIHKIMSYESPPGPPPYPNNAIFVKKLVQLIFNKNCPNQLDHHNPSIAHRDIVIGFYFTWDEWGRANRNCHKAGLCNFRLEEIRIEVNCVPVFSKENGELYVQIPVDELIEFEDEQMDFYIDEDLYAVGPDGYTYMIPSGVYEFNPDLFEMGGFELPLIFIN